MTRLAPSAPDAPLRALIAAATGRTVLTLQRQSSDYYSTYPMEHLRATLDNGQSLSLLFKDLSPNPAAPHRNVKPAFLLDPLREINVYRHVLAPLHPDVPRLFASRADASSGEYWLLLENLPGAPLYEVGDFSLWQFAARRLAALHARFAHRTRELAATVPLLRHDCASFLQWPRRALALLAKHRPEDRDRLALLCARYDPIADLLASLPQTFLHGECYASNIIASAAPPRICFVDWEMAATGPGLLDLAALVAGRWTSDQRTSLAQSYYQSYMQESVNNIAPLPPFPAFLRALQFARLHIAVQWVGWSDHWSPPKAHAQDWLGEALALAHELEVLP